MAILPILHYPDPRLRNKALPVEGVDAAVRTLLRADPVDLQVDLGLATWTARAWGCDLTHGYVDENAAYYSS